MDKTKALQKLLNGTATKKEIELLKQALASGEISIGGDVTDSNLISGNDNINVTNKDGTINIFLTPDKASLLLDVKPSETQEPIAGEPPYMGLRYFDTSDADLFYGREALTHELFARVQKESFLAIVGASGSGKSSVARAGLIPAWTKENERGAIHVITPTAHPLESLAASLTRESESITATSTLMDDMNRDARSLRLYVKKTLGETKSLLLVDQFEETFTLCKDADERVAFIENLLSLADDDAQSAARVVITLRADFYAHCAEYDGLRFVLDEHHKYIGAMTPDELRQAITAPAQSAGWDFQPGLVDLILQDVGTEPGALPLLSHALLETWKRRQGHTLTLKGYADAGGVKKAIAQTAESVYDKLTPAEQTIAREIFLRLTELGEGVQDTRRRVKCDELLSLAKDHDIVQKLLKTLSDEDARLITIDADSVEVAHEALIREWGTLRRWLDEDRESLRLHRHLTESAEAWERSGRDEEELYRGARLNLVKRWAIENNNLVNSLEKEFIKRSLARNRNTIIFGFGFILFIILCTFYFATTGQIDRSTYRPLGMENYWITIPAGKFLMGSTDKDIKYAMTLCSDCNFSDEQPQHWVNLSEFQIGKYEVTNKQYNQCIRAGVCAGTIVVANLDNPVVYVNWYASKKYCEWTGGRLPNETEWEKAANWDVETQTKFIYPWGNNDPSFDLLNYSNIVGGTTPVGNYPAGENGLFDMAGNVLEWVSSIYMSYPYVSNDGRENINLSSARILRGGSWLSSDNNVRTTIRSYENPTFGNNYVGFRCARDIP